MLTNNKKVLTNSEIVDMIFDKNLDNKISNKNFVNFLKDAKDSGNVNEYIKKNIVQTMNYETLKNI